MNEIAQAIANRQSEIDRLQAEIKALTDVEQILGASTPKARSTSRRSSSPPDEGGCRGRQQVRGQAGEEAPGDVGRGEEGGIGAHDRLLGRTEEEGGQEVAPPAHRGPAGTGPG